MYPIFIAAIAKVIVRAGLLFIIFFIASFSDTFGQKRAKTASMAPIPGTTFAMGTEASQTAEIAKAFHIEEHPDLIEAETPRHNVTVSSFYLDKYETTNAEFAKFLKKHPEWRSAAVSPEFNNGNYLKGWANTYFPKGKGDYPVTNVSWYAAVAYCQSAGKRLPTEAEWEYAASGGLNGKTFPWGDLPADKTRANYGPSGLRTTARVGSYPANGFGLFDMAGNVWEFTSDEWRPYEAGPRTDPVAGGDRFSVGDSYRKITTRRVIRGGSYGGSPLNLRIAYRDSHPPNGSQDFVGFRCAK